MLYLFLTVLLLISSLNNPLHGNDKARIAANWKIILLWPIIISAVRLVLMIKSFGFGAIDSPTYYLMKYQSLEESGTLKRKLEEWYGKVYAHPEEVTNNKISEYNATKDLP